MSSQSLETALQKFRARVKSCPEPGNGVHQWFYHAACCAVDTGLPDEEAIVEIEALAARDPIGSEIEDALASARGERRSKQPRWSRPNPIAIAKVANEGWALKKLIQRSPEPIDLAGLPKTDQIIDLLFPGDCWLCCGRTDWMFYTRRKSVWLAASLDGNKLQNFSLVVPSPMSEQWGRTKKGEFSYHAESNTGNRRFLVVNLTPVLWINRRRCFGSSLSTHHSHRLFFLGQNHSTAFSFAKVSRKRKCKDSLIMPLH